LLYKKSKVKSEKLHQQLKPKEPFDLSSRDLHFNLPEFLHFQSDHLVLTPKLISHSSYDRLRSSSTFQTSKFNRQPTPSPPTTSNPTVYSPTKRLPRSRHSYDTTLFYEKQQQQQQQQQYSARQMMNKFDSMSCFNEVRRLVVFFFFPACSFKHITFIA